MLNTQFKPQLPLPPPSINFDNMEDSERYLKQSASFYRRYANYLEELATCKTPFECLAVGDKFSWSLKGEY